MRLALCATISGFGLAACSGGGGPNPSPSASITPILPSGLPSGVPSGLPSASGLGVFHSGTAQLTLTGDIESEVSFDRIGGTTIWQPPDGGMAITFINGKGDAFGIGGQAFTGTKKTATLLVASMAIGNDIFTSVGGECSVTVSKATPTQLRGSITCDRFTQNNKTIGATGTFEASA
jgi:hypothetical protein